MTMQLFLIISNLKKKRFRGRKALSHLALHLVLSQRCTFYPCWSEFTAQKRLEDNTYNLPMVSTNWTGHPFKMPRRNYFSWRIGAIEITALLRLKKGKRLRLLWCQMVVWSSFDLHDWERSWKITILVNIGDQERPINIRAIASWCAYPHATSKRLFLKGRTSTPAHSWLLLHETESQQNKVTTMWWPLFSSFHKHRDIDVFWNGDN